MDAETTELINQGRRDLVCGEITKAVDAFQKACETLTTAHTDTGDILGEPYLYYGSALLELARMESNVLGNALDGVPDEEDAEEGGDFIEKGESMTEEEKEKLSEEVVDAMCVEEEKQEEAATEEGDKKENGDGEAVEEKPEEESAETKEGDKETKVDGDAEKGDEEKTEEEDAETKEGDKETKVDGDAEKGDEEKTEEEDAETKEDGEEEGEDQEEENEDKEGEEGDEEIEGDDKDNESEDVSNLQLGWEVLELAQKIFVARGDDKENQLKVAECCEKLAEIGQEKEDMVQALEDLGKCLEIRKRLLDGDDRLLAETYYQMALAHSGAQNFDEALEGFKTCANVLEKRIDNLEIKKTEEGVDEETKTKLETEISQIKELLPEIKSKLSDVEEERLDADQLKKMVREGLKSTLEKVEEGFSGSTSTEGADDISHLVRKKRKADSENGVSPAKKVCVEENSHTNGHSENGKEITAKTVEKVTGDAVAMESETVA